MGRFRKVYENTTVGRILWKKYLTDHVDRKLHSEALRLRSKERG
jgi:hypothetical protein